MNFHQQLYKIYGEDYNTLLSYARNIVGKEIADDIVQVSFEYLLRRLKNRTGKFKKIKKMDISLVICTIRCRAKNYLKKQVDQPILYTGDIGKIDKIKLTKNYRKNNENKNKR